MPLPSSSTSTSISSSYSHTRPSDWSRQNLNRIEQFCIQCRQSVPVRPNAFHIATIVVQMMNSNNQIKNKNKPMIIHLSLIHI